MWVGTLNGLNIFDRDTEKFDRYNNSLQTINNLSNNDIRAIYEDKSSNLWVGTRGGGLNKIDIKPKNFKSYMDRKNINGTLSDKNVASAIEDSAGIIWIGTNNGGLDKLDSKRNTIEYFMKDITKEENRNLGSISEANDSLWIGSLGGLNRFDKNTGKIVTYKNKPNEPGTLSNNTVLSVFKDSSETIWVGTLLGGLNQYDKTKDKFISYMANNGKNSISSNTVNCIYEDSGKNLWIGTQNGLNEFDRKSNVFTVFNYNENNSNGISSNLIYCIFEDSGKNLWIGTQSGLNKFDKNTKGFKLYTTKEGLPNNKIDSITEDLNGNLWISTNLSISMFNTNDEKFTNYNSLDGLQGNGYNNNACAKTKNGEIIFCGTNGFDLFNPNNVSKSSFIPPVVISNFTIMDKPVNLSEILQNKNGIKLTYKDKVFSLEVSSLDFTNPEKNQYAYKLEGFDKAWNYTGSRRYLSYTNLQSGKYILKIKGTNSDGVWNENGISIPVTVVPPLWANSVAYAIYLCILILSTYLVIRYYISKKEKNLEDQFKSLIMVLSSTLDIDEVLKKFLESFMQIVPFDKAGVILKKDDAFIVGAEIGFDENINSIIEIDEVEKIVKEISNTSLPYIFNEEGEQSWLGIPIIHNEKLEGIVVLFRKAPNFYGAKEGKIGSIFAAQAGFALKNADLFDELEKVNGELRSRYIIDELTGLYNRRGFNAHGDNLYNAAMLTGGKFILCYGDLDGLKSINDTFGHKEGDEAILTAALLIKKSFDKDDIIARMGGDEFTMISANKSSEKEIDEIVKRIKYNFEEYNLISKKPYKLAISLGFSVYLSNVKLTFKELLHEADKKLYEQKKNRNVINN